MKTSLESFYIHAFLQTLSSKLALLSRYTFYQFLLSLGIKPMTLTLLVPRSIVWTQLKGFLPCLHHLYLLLFKWPLCTL